jgi:tRNA G18 (ribose-2'-O)-methylase SpoU
MTRRGFFGIGIYNLKRSANFGGLLRNAQAFGADFVFTIGARQLRYGVGSGNTGKAERHIPVFNFIDWETFLKERPYGCMLTGIEYSADVEGFNLRNYTHFEREVYILGAEDTGLSKDILEKCNSVVFINTGICLNVATTGALIMYDRSIKRLR